MTDGEVPRHTVEDAPDGRFRVIDWDDRGQQIGPDLWNRDIAFGLAERMNRLAAEEAS